MNLSVLRPASIALVSVLTNACANESTCDRRLRNAYSDRSHEASAEGRASMKRNDETNRVMAALHRQHERVGELRRMYATADAEATLYRGLAHELRRMVDARDLILTPRHGRMVIQLSDDVLFEPGRGELTPGGKRTLSGVAAVLATMPDRRFQIGGHTDDQPIRMSAYKSNWELSTARALSVTSFLITEGLAPHLVSAAGYGQFDPIDTNETTEGMARNRRTEISVEPNLDDLVDVP